MAGRGDPHFSGDSLDEVAARVCGGGPAARLGNARGTVSFYYINKKDINKETSKMKWLAEETKLLDGHGVCLLSD